MTYIRQLIKLATHLTSKRIRIRERKRERNVARARLFPRDTLVVSARITRALELVWGKKM